MNEEQSIAAETKALQDKPADATVTTLPKRVNIKKTTLAELGPRLPHGIADVGGNLIKDIAVRPWRFKEEKELGKLLDKNREATMVQYTSMVLGAMYTQMGPSNFEAMNEAERRLAVAQLEVGDAFYAYCWLRRESLGPHLKMDITCASCLNVFPFKADLDTLAVSTVEKPEDALWEYCLQDPYEIRGKLVEKFMMGQAKWQSLEGAEPSGRFNTGAAKAIMIRACVKSFGDMGSVPIMDNDLDEMSKRDIEGILEGIDNNHVGPDMSIEHVCKRCGSQIRTSIDWSHGSFFGASSR